MPLGMSKQAFLNSSGIGRLVKKDLVLLMDAGDLSSYPRSGSTWFDLSPNENNGTLVGSPAYNQSRNGALFFRGTASSQYVSIPHDATSMDFSNQQTICMWILPIPPTTKKRRNPYNQAFGGPGTITHEINETFTYFFGTNGGNDLPYSQVSSSFTVDDDELAFIAVTRNQSTNAVRWYKNGSFTNSGNAGGYASTANGSNPILLGDGYVDGFLGNIYFCSVYNRALSDAEILQNYNATRRRYEKDLTGWANFGEGLQSEGLNSYSFAEAVDYTSSEGGSLVFNGTTNSHINFSASVGSTTTSVEMWVKLDASYSGNMLFGWLRYDVWCGGGDLAFNSAAGDRYGISSATVSSLGLVGNWKHYVFEMRSDVSYTNNKIYINGVSQTLSQQAGTENAANRTFNSGNGRIAGWLQDNSYRMPMNCAAFKVYNRALTQEEIDAKYDEFSSRFS
jgi:hypothetical protein